MIGANDVRSFCVCFYIYHISTVYCASKVDKVKVYQMCVLLMLVIQLCDLLSVAFDASQPTSLVYIPAVMLSDCRKNGQPPVSGLALSSSGVGGGGGGSRSGSDVVVVVVVVPAKCSAERSEIG